jgi:hypothetical protein
MVRINIFKGKQTSLLPWSVPKVRPGKQKSHAPCFARNFRKKITASCNTIPLPIFVLQTSAMQKTIVTILLSFILVQTIAQSKQKATTFLLAQLNATVHDRTVGNNPWGAGLGIQTFFSSKTKFKAVVELTGDIYLADDKILRVNTDGTSVTAVNDGAGMVNLFMGCSYHPDQHIYLSLMTGPSFINGSMLLGIKPSVGFYFSKTQRLMGKFSYINIFNRDKATKEDFGSFSLAIGIKIF